MEFKNITIRGDNNTINKSIFSKEFTKDPQGYTWLNPKSIKMIDSKYTSFDLSWDPIPGAESYALILIDYDFAKYYGFPFLHWVVANIQNTYLEASANLNNKDIIQGVNSSVPVAYGNKKGIAFDVLPSGYKSGGFEDAIGFFPILTREKPRMLCLTIIGLSVKEVDLENGFFLVEFGNKTQKHIVGAHHQYFLFDGNRE